MTRRKIAQRILPAGTITLVILSACTQSYVKPLPAVSVPKSLPNLAGRSPQMVTLSSMSYDMPVGKALGQIAAGVSGHCSVTRPIIYNKGAVKIETDSFQTVFRSVMHEVGVPVQQLIQQFPGQEIRKADLQIAGTIKDLALNLCLMEFNVDQDHVRGDAYEKIDWEVFSPVEKRVVFTAATEGRTAANTETRLGEAGLIIGAFDAALRNLVARPDFQTLLVGPHPLRTAVAAQRLELAQPPKSFGDIHNRLEAIQDGVVVIQSNDGEGSGFAIGAGDYVVTSAHVVASSTSVKIFGKNAVTAYGDVLRRDASHDLALIKLRSAKFQPLYLSRDIPSPGEEVYAVGSPLGKKFAFSITKGVVSAVRREKNLDYIQSDVLVLPGSSGGPLLDAAGNVVGVTEAGVTLSGVPAGMNFFAPARDIFSALSLVDTDAQ